MLDATIGLTDMLSGDASRGVLDGRCGVENSEGVIDGRVGVGNSDDVIDGRAGDNSEDVIDGRGGDSASGDECSSGSSGEFSVNGILGILLKGWMSPFSIWSAHTARMYAMLSAASSM